MKLSRYKHKCDRCENNTIINGSDRLAWYNFKHESLCASCFRRLTEQERNDANEVSKLMLFMSFEALKYSLTSGKEGSLTRTLVGEEKELMQRFVVKTKE